MGAVDWSRPERQGTERPAFLAELVSDGAGDAVSGELANLVLRLRQAESEAERGALLLEFVGDEAQSVLRLSSAPPPDVGFFELGMDSLTAVELRNRVNRGLAGEYVAPNTVVFDYPTIAKLSRHLAEELSGISPAGRAAPAIRAASEERIALVGMGCRFPGGRSPEAFWDQLAGGRDAVTKGRPDYLALDAATREAASFGAYLDEMDRFDAGFFRIAPVEAELMDPQQRLLLETSWEALEHAGMDPGGLRGSRTGVYVGISNSDYRDLVWNAEGDPARSLYASTGASCAAAIGRVAFALGLEGPAMAVDTACSASLVAMHQAAAALSRGEVSLALAGGVNAILTSGLTRVFEDAGMLSADGRCKTFDARANGYVRGEGCGILVLKRLSDAERDGDRILGVLLGSAVNQDGASAGLTVPNGPAQERVIREAVGRAGIEPGTVDYLEAHGTGTELGDPIEVRAAASVYGEGRSEDRPLLLGSVKTNVGHLEAAAGVAGVVKVLLAMRHGVIPRHLHFETPNPKLDWEALPVRVTSEATPWPEVSGRPVRAGVSSFGFSGTNAHVVLEGYEGAGETSGAAVTVPSELAPDPGVEPGEREVRVLPLSGRSGQALGELAGRYREWLSGDGEWDAERLADVAWTAGTGRSHFAHRAGLAFRDGEELRERLAALEERGAGVVARVPGKVAFLFTGQGSQWVGMGRDLYDREPVFRGVLDRCEAAFGEEREGASLLSVMFGREDAAGDLDRTSFTQPALFALGAGLTELWRGVGVEPDAVLGHSVGEIGAAWASGAIGLEEGLRFAARRGALMGSLPSGGGMAAVFGPAAEVEAEIGKTNARVKGVGLSLGAENGTHVVVSGPLRLVSSLCRRLGKRRVRTERLVTSHAFHSGLLEPVLEELESAAAAFDWGSLSAPLVSNLTGRVAVAAEVGEGGYWRRQARSPVRFAAGVRTLSELGVGTVIEVGPRAVLGPLAALSWPESGSGPAVVSSLGRERSFTEGVAAAYEAGVSVSFAGLFAGERRRRIALPTYPFQRKRYWATPSGTAAAQGHRTGVRELLYSLEWRETPDMVSAAAERSGRAAGSWLLAVSGSEGLEAAGFLAEGLQERGEMVAVAGSLEARELRRVAPYERESWRSLIEEVAADAPLAGIVYLGGLDGRGAGATTAQLREDVKASVAAALALTQGIHDAGASPRSGTWFVTRGAQVIGGEESGGVVGVGAVGFRPGGVAGAVGSGGASLRSGPDPGGWDGWPPRRGMESGNRAGGGGPGKAPAGAAARAAGVAVGKSRRGCAARGPQLPGDRRFRRDRVAGGGLVGGTGRRGGGAERPTLADRGGRGGHCEGAAPPGGGSRGDR